MNSRDKFKKKGKGKGKDAIPVLPPGWKKNSILATKLKGQAKEVLANQEVDELSLLQKIQLIEEISQLVTSYPHSNVPPSQLAGNHAPLATPPSNPVPPR
jgi:hypothetical protein